MADLTKKNHFETKNAKFVSFQKMVDKKKPSFSPLFWEKGQGRDTRTPLRNQNIYIFLPVSFQNSLFCL